MKQSEKHSPSARRFMRISQINSTSNNQKTNILIVHILHACAVEKKDFIQTFICIFFLTEAPSCCFHTRFGINCTEKSKCSFRVSTPADYGLNKVSAHQRKKRKKKKQSLAAAAHNFVLQPGGLKLALIRCIT